MSGLVNLVVSAPSRINFTVSCSSARGLCTSLTWFQRAAPAVSSLGPKTTKGVQAIPYSKLTIGVPKESWTNERRFVLVHFC